jgi:hypothetical protein
VKETLNEADRIANISVSVSDTAQWHRNDRFEGGTLYFNVQYAFLMGS